MKSYTYKLYPSKEQKKELEHILVLQKHLYNAALEEKIDSYRKGVKRSRNDQYQSLKEIRNDDSRYADLSIVLLRGTLKRLDAAFNGFFSRVKKNKKSKAQGKKTKKPGFPRFKSHMKSFQFTDFAGIQLRKGHLCFKGVTGGLRVKIHSPIIGDIKTCTIRKDSCGDWFVTFQVRTDKQVEPKSIQTMIGIDSGLIHLLATSDGEFIENPRFAKKETKELRRRQRAHSRSIKDSDTKEERRVTVARLHRKVKNTKSTYLHQVSRKLVDENDLICAENLNLKGLKRSNLGKSFSDAGIGLLHGMIAYKAVSAGKHFVQVDPKYTSQMCSGCGALVPKELSERTHKCPTCKLELDRDINAAINILHKGVVPLGIPKQTPLLPAFVGRKNLLYPQKEADTI